ncbi:hypothetical protein T459_08926 [Capsicum annuum]|uniref:Uncharacterized protein n=1 Tax=Capsicum annuum TaxID=4072 RepID=A0A2G2ZXW0_CAPAN|nr:hypothetical protein T459_08926 [Capsicum annuum]
MLKAAELWLLQFYQANQVHDLLKTYTVIEVPPERLLFKIPATWQGIEASRILEAEGIQTHLTFVYRYYSGLPYYIVRNGDVVQGIQKVLQQNNKSVAIDVVAMV